MRPWRHVSPSACTLLGPQTGQNIGTGSSREVQSTDPAHTMHSTFAVMRRCFPGQLNGADFLEQPELSRRLIGWLPERAPVWAELTVSEHLDAHGRLRGLSVAALRQARSAII